VRSSSLKERAGVDEQSGRSGHSGGSSSGSGRRPGELSTLQKLGVGFAGEWLAYQWVAQQYGPDFTQECWVSKYREQVLPGSGNDGLGWDFEVPVRRGKHYYEVKSPVRRRAGRALLRLRRAA